MTKIEEDSSRVPNSHSRNWFERNPKKTIIFLVGFVVIFLDLILAPFFAERIPNIKDQNYHHGMVPNYHGTVVWGTKKYIIYTNCLGFKDRANRNVKLQTDKYRLLFIGDSFTEGVGFPYEETFVGIIDDNLDKSTYEVLNAGVSYFSPKLYYLKVKYLLENVGLKFNELYVFFDISDIQEEIEFEDFQPTHSSLLSMLYRLNYWVKRYSFIGNVALRELIKMRRASFLSNLGSDAPRKTANSPDQRAPSQEKPWENQDEYDQYRGTWTYNDEIFAKWGKRGFALAVENMDRLFKLCQEHHIKMTIAVYPWPHEIRHHNLNSRNVTLWQDFCKKRDIFFLNCYPYFFSSNPPESIIEKYFIKNDNHFELDGHKLMAKAWLDHFNATKVAGNQAPERLGIDGQRSGQIGE
ncbi:MAG: hypothetical protein NTY36_16700 [Deltaproteobacteria bacterium]|nr:hypothetical protein [Deltaproteobacteria bacterium]